MTMADMPPADFLTAPFPDPVDIDGDIAGPNRSSNRELS